MNTAPYSATHKPTRWLGPVHALIAGILLCVLAYLPGLSGGFTFDDYPNIVDNTGIHVSENRLGAWMEAAWSSPSSAFRRPLASLSFAVNHIFTGLDPRPMKAANLGLHLANGILLFLLLRLIVRSRSREEEHPPSTTRPRVDPVWIAACVAVIWLLHPINLTSVLYVVQRMESLANAFVLLGLLAYTRARTAPDLRGRLLMWLAFPACLALGMSTKESAALLPVYALGLELCIFRARGSSKAELAAFFSVFLLLPAILAAAFILPQFLDPAAYAMREWTLLERLLSQPRALLTYAGLIALPLPGSFGFYYDHFPISSGLTTPWTTLPALLAIVGIAIGTIFLVRRHPLIALGFVWFLSGHLITSSVIPLEIAFEHRNYFASAGLLLAGVSLLLHSPARAGQVVGPAVVIVLLILSTYGLADRAREWSHPVRLAAAEAERNPSSARALYGHGVVLAQLGDYDPDSPHTRRAIEQLERASHMKGSSTLAEVALITVASRSGLEVREAWWDALRSKLTTRQVFAQDDTAIANLVDCRVRGRCPLNDQQLLATLMTAVGRERPSPSMLYSYAIFAYNVLGEPQLALQLARDAAIDSEPQFHLNLVNYLIALGKHGEAGAELDALRARLRPGQLASGVRRAENVLRQQEQGSQ